jgi:hypothetical protein
MVGSILHAYSVLVDTILWVGSILDEYQGFLFSKILNSKPYKIKRLYTNLQYF